MSSLQKFHRRTQTIGKPAPAIGSESPIAGAGFYLGKAGDGISYMYVAPKSTETSFGHWSAIWGSYGTARGTISATDGTGNTSTLYALGSAAHPAAYYCKTLTTGGYNTWYLPAINELQTMYSNSSRLPFAQNDAFINGNNYLYLSSTENNATGVWAQYFVSGWGQYNRANKSGSSWNLVRAARRV